ncbi:hypothetical protein [Salegentibacter maritimus]|uniref:Uncharacterized protein n=1 Tax=Salegentibacter maritimus TaxID=2794347 RepID=A0ABS0TCY5_9FLAO|nr:hypothetical protein [Salegentibacter maritimus]MBI6118868.1 hypothetical protein [Salegentibacter maritimus]
MKINFLEKQLRKEVLIMAKDSEGRKFNRIPGHTKTVGGKAIKVKPHIRSNRNDSNENK